MMKGKIKLIDRETCVYQGYRIFFGEYCHYDIGWCYVKEVVRIAGRSDAEIARFASLEEITADIDAHLDMMQAEWPERYAAHVRVAEYMGDDSWVTAPCLSDQVGA